MINHYRIECNGSLLPALPGNQRKTLIEVTLYCVLPVHNTPRSFGINILVSLGIALRVLQLLRASQLYYQPEVRTNFKVIMLYTK